MVLPTSAAHGQPLGVCAIHPEHPAKGTCARCGSFFCGDCHKEIAGRAICEACLRIPGVDHLRALRERYWGKRDGWVWYFGITSGLGGLGLALEAVAHRDWVRAALNFAHLGLAIPYVMLLRWARLWVIMWLPLAVLGLLQAGPLPQGTVAPELVALGRAGRLLLLGLFLTAAYTSARNKLAFRIEVSESELQKLYARTFNTAASRALFYGLLSLLVPFLGFASLALGRRGLRAADAPTWPPVGGRKQAIWGIALSVLGLLFWLTVFVVLAFG